MTDAAYSYRPIDWDADSAALLNFEASFVTDRIYRLVRSGLEARFVEEKLPQLLVKRYDLSGIRTALDESCFSVIAESPERVAAFMVVKLENWNRRVWITHLYVQPQHRGRGLGKTLISKAVAHAKELEARGLLLETQNFNYPAIGFYLSQGFHFSGFDADLYDPGLVPGETAMYFGIDIV